MEIVHLQTKECVLHSEKIIEPWKHLDIRVMLLEHLSFEHGVQKCILNINHVSTTILAADIKSEQ